jgi:hypothetical protein
VLNKYKILPKNKVRMSIPLCQLLSMLVVHPTFKLDVLKMERAFQMGCQEGEKTFYVSFTNGKDRRKG